MKKKVILSSILSIVMCLSLVVGGTFALFTSEDQTNIAVNSANVEVTATLEKADGEWVYSPTAIDYTTEEIVDETNVADQTTGKFVNGGYASIDAEKLTLTNMTPGDEVRLQIRIHNASTVAVKYQTRLWVSNDDGLFKGLEIKVDGNPFTLTQQSSWTDMAVDCDDIIVPVVITLPEGAGNDYQSKKTEISFSVSAVQANASTDALDNNAPDTVYLYSANDLFMFAKDVNENGNTYAGKTVVLVNSVNLGGKEWKPIGQTGQGYHHFLGDFDGNENTVSNFYIDTTGGFYPEGADVATGFFGWISETSQTISNLKLDNFSVTAYRRPAGIAGYITGTASIINCHVSNATITAIVEPLSDGGFDNGDKAGGIVGYTNSGNTVKDCSVTSTTISGYRDIGGIVGFNYGTVDNCKVDGVTINAGGNHNYNGYMTDAEFHANAIVGEEAGVTKTSTENNVTITVNVPVSDSEDLANRVKEASGNATIYLGATTYEFPIVDGMTDKAITFVGTKGTVIDATKVTQNHQNFRGSTFTFENLTINWALENAGYQGFANGVVKVTYNNCTLTGTQFMYGDADFNNCTFITPEGFTGYNVYGRGSGTLNFTNCEFYTAGRSIMLYNDGPTKVNVNLTDCKFYDTVGTVYTDPADPKAAVETGDNLNAPANTSEFNITFTNCTAEGFEANKSTDSLWGNKNNIGTDRLNVVIDGNDVY